MSIVKTDKIIGEMYKGSTPIYLYGNPIVADDGIYYEGFSAGVAEQKSKLESITINANGTYEKEDGYNSIVVDVPNIDGSYDEGFAAGIEEQKSKLTSITITDNGEFTSEDGYSTVVVDVAGGGTTGSLVLVDGTKLSHSTFTEVPDYYDLSNIIDVSYMFYDCKNLKSIPQLDTSNSTNMKFMFNHCTKIKSIPQLDTSKVTDMEYMFYSCSDLESIPQLDTSNVTNMGNMFVYCISLKTIPQLDTSKVTDMGWMFAYSNYLQSLPAFDASNVTNMDEMFRYTMKDLTNVGGWINLSCNWDDSGGLKVCPKLTYESCINILNGLADVTEIGDRALKVHQNFLDLVGDKISIATQKGWRITS